MAPIARVSDIETKLMLFYRLYSIDITKDFRPKMKAVLDYLKELRMLRCIYPMSVFLEQHEL